MQLSREDEMAIRAHLSEYLDSVNSHQRDAATARLTAAAHLRNLINSNFHEPENSIFVGAAGTSVGNAEIAQRFADMYSGRFKDAKITMRIMSITPISQGVAVAGGNCIAAGIKRLNGEPVPDLESNSVFTLVKTDGAWKIAAQAVVNKTA
jgi:hypothetical protein